jgi:hypothetical protein
MSRLDTPHPEGDPVDTSGQLPAPRRAASFHKQNQSNSEISATKLVILAAVFFIAISATVMLFVLR